MQDRSRRLEELLAGEAAGELDREELAELAALLAEAGSESIERAELEHAAALAQLAFLKNDGGPSDMPADLQARLMARADEWSGKGGRTAEIGDLEAARRRRARTGSTPPASARTGIISGRTGWYIAACLALALALSLLSPPEAPVPTTAADFVAQREALLGEADVIVAPWAPSEQPGYESVTGDVVWSGGRQEGFLRLTGLPPNEAAVAQYQLWIVAPDRDTHPVDGGVFDIGESGEVLVKIDAKLQVPEPAAFAITLEKPGGVVVSAGPLLVVAPVGS